MKKILLVSSAVALSITLAGCHTMNDTSRFANATVGKGVKYTVTTVGAGVGVVSNTGAAIGKGVGTVVDKGVGLVDGRHTGYQKNNAKAQTVYHNGHKYKVQNGKYVRVN